LSADWSIRSHRLAAVSLVLPYVALPKGSLRNGCAFLRRISAMSRDTTPRQQTTRPCRVTTRQCLPTKRRCRVTGSLLELAGRSRRLACGDGSPGRTVSRRDESPEGRPPGVHSWEFGGGALCCCLDRRESPLIQQKLHSTRGRSEGATTTVRSCLFPASTLGEARSNKDGRFRRRSPRDLRYRHS